MQCWTEIDFGNSVGNSRGMYPPRSVCTSCACTYYYRGPKTNFRAFKMSLSGGFRHFRRRLYKAAGKRQWKIIKKLWFHNIRTNREASVERFNRLRNLRLPTGTGILTYLLCAFFFYSLRVLPVTTIPRHSSLSRVWLHSNCLRQFALKSSASPSVAICFWNVYLDVSTQKPDPTDNFLFFSEYGLTVGDVSAYLTKPVIGSPFPGVRSTLPVLRRIRHHEFLLYMQFSNVFGSLPVIAVRHRLRLHPG